SVKSDKKRGLSERLSEFRSFRRNAKMRRVSEGQLHLGGVSLFYFLSEKKVIRKESKQRNERKTNKHRLLRRFAPHNDT
ncbi:MAG: hypothetical protein LBS73_06035, partial [Campylobacteraceae bacterium]|nr:hypothetical protein [Campylobacteraceae bacterium]